MYTQDEYDHLTKEESGTDGQGKKVMESVLIKTQSIRTDEYQNGKIGMPNKRSRKEG